MLLVAQLVCANYGWPCELEHEEFGRVLRCLSKNLTLRRAQPCTGMTDKAASSKSVRKDEMVMDTKYFTHITLSIRIERY